MIKHYSLPVISYVLLIFILACLVYHVCNVCGFVYVLMTQFDQEGDEDEDEPTEVFFNPEDPADVQQLFDIFSEAALNNPDDDADDDEDDNEDGDCGAGMFPSGFIYNVEEVETGAQQAKLNQWESVFQLPAEQKPEEDSSAMDMETETDAAATGTQL